MGETNFVPTIGWCKNTFSPKWDEKVVHLCVYMYKVDPADNLPKVLMTTTPMTNEAAGNRFPTL